MNRISCAIVATAIVACIAIAAPAADRSAYTGEHMPYRAMEELPSDAVMVGASTLDVRFAPGDFTLPKNALLRWIENSAKAIAVYYGGFPVASVKILIVPIPGRGVSGGQAFGYRGSAVRLIVGTDSTVDDLERDWKAVHELVHVATPTVAQQHLWMSEGLAVYVESIARVQSGDLTEQKIWTDFVRDMPQGLPQAGDRGLDFTATWGRTYWGGAIFWMLADIEIRKRSHNTLGLQDGLKAVAATGGSNTQEWSVERLLDVIDKATGQTVMQELYAKMRADPYEPDLAGLWRDLGVESAMGAATFNSAAILAPIRKAITAAPAG